MIVRHNYRVRLKTLMLFCCLLATSASVFPSELLSPPPIAFVGRWTSSAPHPTAGEVTIVVSIAQTMRFSGSATVDGRPYWTYGGTVRIDGQKLVWHYDVSSIALPEASRTDVDDILSVDAERIVLRSQRSGGALRTFLRVR